MEEITGYFGRLGLPAAMTLVMACVYKVFLRRWSDRVKTLVVVGLGMVLSGVSVVYIGKVLTFVSIVDCIFYGVELGFTSIGGFKVGQALGVFRKDPKGGG